MQELPRNLALVSFIGKVQKIKIGDVAQSYLLPKSIFPLNQFLPHFFIHTLYLGPGCLQTT